MRTASRRALLVPAFFLGLLAPTQTTHGQYTLKTAQTPAPTEVKEPIRNLLDAQSVQVLDSSGQIYCEIWLRKSVPAKATDEQIKNGLTYRELDETTVIGAIRFAQPAEDFRKQKVNPGVYTLRLAFQPMDGDHMGTAPNPEFCLLVGADKDAKADPMEAKQLHEASAKTLGGNHPGVLLLFPNEKPPDAPKLTDKGMGQWAVEATLKVDANGKPAKLGISLNVAGHSSAA